MIEDKALFTKRINDALVECGAGRYEFLRRAPLEYERDGCRETVRTGDLAANVSMDSLPAMMIDIAERIIMA